MSDRSDARLLIDTLRLTPPDKSPDLTAEWKRADAHAIIRLAEHEGVALWLQRRLTLLHIRLEGGARERLRAAAKAAAAQCLRIDAESSATLAVFAQAGVRCVPLKAAAVRLLSASVPYATSRAPGDVDVLCHPDDAQRGWMLLKSRGYASPKSAPADGHHLPALVGPSGIGVEIHLSTTARMAPEEAWRRATCDQRAVRTKGGVHAIPGETELVWHSLAHSVVSASDVGRSGTRLKHWLDAAAILSAGVDMDWPRIAQRLERGESEHPALARAWLGTAIDLGGRRIPEAAAIAPAGSGVNIERMLAWRLHVLRRKEPRGRWAEKLLEEGARGEAGLPFDPAGPRAGALARVRHALASRAARAWWTIRR